MLLYIQIIGIVVLTSVLILTYLEENQKKKSILPTGKLTHIWNGSERRRFVRIPVNVPVRYNLSKGINNPKVAMTNDISTGGICITIKEKLSPNCTIDLEIEPEKSSTPILAKGQIVWVKETAKQKNAGDIRYFNIGVEFREILPKEKERLYNFIKGLKETNSG